MSSIIKEQYSIADKTNYKILIRNKMYDVDYVIRDLMKAIEQLNVHVDRIAKLYDLEISFDYEK